MTVIEVQPSEVFVSELDHAEEEFECEFEGEVEDDGDSQDYYELMLEGKDLSDVEFYTKYGIDSELRESLRMNLRRESNYWLMHPSKNADIPRKNYMEVEGVKCYYTYYKYSKGDTPKEPQHPHEEGTLVISCEYSYKGKLKRCFAWFSSPIVYLHWARNPKVNAIFSLAFYEYIKGSHPQKIKFDLDLSLVDGLNVKIKDRWPLILDDLVTNIIRVMRDVGVELDLAKDVIMTDSSVEGHKKSAHIIIDNYILPDVHAVKIICLDVISGMCPENNTCESLDDDDVILNGTIIDESVYSSMQQFRLIYCMKFGKTNVKLQQYEWVYKGETIKFNGENLRPYIIQSEDPVVKEYINELPFLITSMIGFYMGKAGYSKRIERDKISALHTIVKKPKIFINERNLDDDEVKYIMSLLEEQPYGNQYKYRGLDGIRVDLSRVNPGPCSICNRVHDNEGAFIYTNGKGECKFVCRRNTSKVLSIGHLTDRELIVSEMVKCIPRASDSILPSLRSNITEVPIPIPSHTITFVPTRTLTSTSTPKTVIAPISTPKKVFSVPTRQTKSFVMSTANPKRKTFNFITE